jgi:hypothetical protein
MFQNDDRHLKKQYNYKKYLLYNILLLSGLIQNHVVTESLKTPPVPTGFVPSVKLSAQE